MSAATSPPLPSVASVAGAADDASAASKGHPLGLYILFGTEMWERFSYYGMRALLVLYMINVFQWQPSDASSVYKWYTSLVYLTPLLGGFLADRYLGLRLSIIIGAVLMAIGHFLMAFPPLPFFYTALAVLIAGNGFFKPNISTLVGKMYRQGDPRRDGAFTIFYMGINIGAFFSPLACGYLGEKIGYHYGFGLAGIGMLVGLVIFLLGQKRVMKDVEAAGNQLAGTGKEKVEEEHKPEPDEALPGVGGFGGVISKAYPWFMIALGVAVPLLYIVQLARGEVAFKAVLMPIAYTIIAGLMGLTLVRIKGASRDKSTVIFVIFIFAVLFWMAFEQAGNALNIWADVNTDRTIAGFTYPASWMQSANAVFVFTIAPLFAMMWTWFANRGTGIPTPVKMFVAMIFVGLSFLTMVAAAASEHSTESRVALGAVPQGVDVAKLNAGRLAYDPATRELTVRGVLAPFAVNEALAASADPKYVEGIEGLEKASKNASEKNPVKYVLPHLPASFAFPLDVEKAKAAGVAWDAATTTISINGTLDDATKAALMGAGAPKEWRESVNALATKSQVARVSGNWLLLSYLLATLGELCLSPVGLSMVTKLAPARFASLFMGVWMLASSAAQYVGGAIGESWGKIPPTSYFMLFVWTSVVGAIAAALLMSPLRKMMHRVT